MITLKICWFLVKGSTFVTITDCRFGNLLISKIPSSSSFKFHGISSKSVFLESPLVNPDQVFFIVVIVILEDLSFIHVHLSFCAQNLISHHITDSTNLKITMQQGGIKTICILGNQINTSLDLPVQWLPR